MSELTKSMCWDLLVVKKDKLNGVAVAIYRKPSSNKCYEERPHNVPPLCKEADDPDAIWYFVMHFYGFQFCYIYLTVWFVIGRYEVYTQRNLFYDSNVLFPN